MDEQQDLQTRIISVEEIVPSVYSRMATGQKFKLYNLALLKPESFSGFLFQNNGLITLS